MSRYYIIHAERNRDVFRNYKLAECMQNTLQTFARHLLNSGGISLSLWHDVCQILNVPCSWVTWHLRIIVWALWGDESIYLSWGESEDGITVMKGKTSCLFSYIIWRLKGWNWLQWIRKILINTELRDTIRLVRPSPIHPKDCYWSPNVNEFFLSGL